MSMISKSLDPLKRDALPINDFEFLSAFKQRGSEVNFLLLHEVRRIPDTATCVMTKTSCLSIGEMFLDMQKKGYGIFFRPNNGGCTKAEISRITTLMIDVDLGKGCRSPWAKEQRKVYCLRVIKGYRPSIIVETKNGFHIYWLVRADETIDLAVYSGLQKAMNKFFDEPGRFENWVDHQINTPERTMRMPNYLHLKNPRAPFKVKCIHFEPSIRYSLNQFLTMLGLSFDDLMETEPLLRQLQLF